MSAFADPEIIRMANEDFVPVAGDDWYQRRRQDAEGEFFRKVADQGPRKGDGGATRQGIYCLTADGELLAYKNAGQDADVMRAVFQQGLARWRGLPEQRRKPGAVTVPERGRNDARYTRTPPVGGLILTVHTRILATDRNGYCKGKCDTLGGDRAARDHLWLTADEARSLVPDLPEPGQRLALPPKVAERLARFHLLDNTRGEPPAWTREQVRLNDIRLIVETVSAERVRLRLEGSALLATDRDPKRAERGYDAGLIGRLEFDRRTGRFTKFDVAAVGDCWGDGTFTRGARPGRQPLGIALELAGSAAADQVPPQFAREWNAYFGR